MSKLSHKFHHPQVANDTKDGTIGFKSAMVGLYVRILQPEGVNNIPYTLLHIHENSFAYLMSISLGYDSYMNK